MARKEDKINASNHKTLLLKFGGTSMGGPSAMQQAAEIIRSQRESWQEVIIVVSAMNGVTNNLIACAEAALARKEKSYRDIIAKLQARHFEAIRELAPPRYAGSLAARH